MTTYKTILTQAKEIKTSVEKEYKKPNAKWSYYICKAILKPKTDIPKISINSATKSTGDDLGRQITKTQYLDMAKRLIKYVETNKQIPNYITVTGMKMRGSDFTYMFARILVYYDKNSKLPTYANVNSKAFIKETETTNTVFKYFIKKFGSISCIDDALEKVDGKGYGYYYDDHKSNIETIDAMANNTHEDDPNCTDSCHVFKNIGDEFVKQGKYKKCDAIHVKCRGGDGHVRLRFTKNNGEVFYRDPACTLSDGGLCNWCMNGTILAVNPSWFMQNLYR